MDVWKLGGATEVEARAAALGGDETVRGADAPTENGERKDCQCGNRRLRRTQRPQRRQRGTETGGVLAHAGLPVCFGNHKGHEGHKASGAGAGRACAKAHVRPGGL